MQRAIIVLLVGVVACGPAVDPRSQIANGNGTAGVSGGTGFGNDPNANLDVYTPTTALPGTTIAQFQLPRGEQRPFLDTPWPSELSRRFNGTIDFSQFPGNAHPVVKAYIDEVEKSVRGFSVTQSAYFKFTGENAPDDRFLPRDPADAMHKGSPIFLMNVDPVSAQRGNFVPLEVRYYPNELTYVPAKTIVAKPMLGFVLEPNTLYAYVVRRNLNDNKGQPLGTTVDFEMIKWTSPRSNQIEEDARKLHKDTFDYLEKMPFEVKRADIAAVALFRTGIPHETTEKLINEAIASLSSSNAPRLVDATWEPVANDKYFTIRGHYCTPNYQGDIDKAPFTQNGGGTLVTDPSGKPVPQAIPAFYRNDGNVNDKDSECTPLMKARFVMTVPKMDMPAGGFPLIISAHGTGGTAESFLGNDNVAAWAANTGYAVVSTDAPLHGNPNDPGRRPGSDKQVIFNFGGIPIAIPSGVTLEAQDMFYNPVNPGAARDNARQATADTTILLRLITGTDFTTAKIGATNTPVLAEFSGRTNPKFQADKTLLMGHSQGSQTVAPQAALDPMVKGVLLSGCGGDIRSGILRRTEPVELRLILQAVMGTQAMELDELHPLMSLAQMIADPVDPQNFAHYYREPLPGRNKMNVLHFIGTNDNYNPRESGQALAIAMRSPQLEPNQGLIPGLTMLGVPTMAGPIVANNGNATMAFIELQNDAGDGHFVLFQNTGAKKLAEQFFASMRDSGTATVGPYTP